MRAVVGDDTSLWKRLPGFFTPGTELYSEEGGEVLKGPRNLEAAKKLLAESGCRLNDVRVCPKAREMLANHLGCDVERV